jgi:hypothetical protein
VTCNQGNIILWYFHASSTPYVHRWLCASPLPWQIKALKESIYYELFPELLVLWKSDIETVLILWKTTHIILVRVQLLPSISRPYWYCVPLIKSTRSCNCWVMYTAECKIFLHTQKKQIWIHEQEIIHYLQQLIFWILDNRISKNTWKFTFISLWIFPKEVLRLFTWTFNIQARNR